MAFKDLFIKSDEVQSQPSQQTEVSKPRSYTSAGANRQVSDNTGVSTSSVKPMATKSITTDDAIVDKIWDKIIASNRPGPDYLELKNGVNSLDRTAKQTGLTMTNEQKLIGAFNYLKDSYPDLVKDDITKAIDFYINVVNNEKESGLKQLEELRIKNVDGAENEIQTMQAKAEELKRQYDELQANIASKTLEVTQAKSDIDIKYNTFVSSVDAVINVLEKDKENVLAINI